MSNYKIGDQVRYQSDIHEVYKIVGDRKNPCSDSDDHVNSDFQIIKDAKDRPIPVSKSELKASFLSALTAYVNS